MKIIFDVSCNDEYFDEYPQTAVIEFNREIIERILMLMEKAKEMDVAKICDWSDDVEWYSNDFYDDEKLEVWDGRYECEMVHIWSDSVSWYAYVKNTSIEFGIGSIYKTYFEKLSGFVDEDITFHISDIMEVIKIYETPKKNLPLLIGDLKSKEANMILTKRLS